MVGDRLARITDEAALTRKGLCTQIRGVPTNWMRLVSSAEIY